MFKGPLFIVGMPRSGTTLLRELINNHPEMSIPIAESLFIPDFFRQFNVQNLPIKEYELFRWFSYLQKTTYVFNLANEGMTINFKQFLSYAEKSKTSTELIAYFLQHYAYLQKPRARLWGDKSPIYRLHIPLLKELYPSARFIHIIRDPRDQANSALKAWGKHPYRSAEQWRIQVFNAHQCGLKLGSDYHMLNYETLLQDSSSSIKKITDFLDLPYSEKMFTLSISREHLGDASGSTEIVKNNFGKYKTKFSSFQIKKIESLVVQTAHLFGYQVDSRVVHQPLSMLEKFLLAFHDAFHTLKFHLAEKGFWVGLKYYFSIRRTR